MSEKEKETEKTEKYVTKYDRKMQRREEEKKKEEKEARVSRIIGVAVVCALVCLIAYFPIRNYMAVHETYIKIGGENISRVEFDYNYNVAINNYVSQYGSYLSYFGLDLTSDLSTQIYDNTTGESWKDFFEQMAVENMTNAKALKAEATANGFTYDTSEEYGVYQENLEAAAEAAGVSVKSYVQQNYGVYATISRLKGFIEEAIYTNAYYNELSDQKGATDEEIEAYYEENKVDYDSVDYYLTTIDAQMPTEPTELADETDETAESTEDTVYQPSEAEQEKAMADAKELADAALETITSDGELQENILSADVPYAIREWLFDESRQEGDSTVIEYETSYRYYVVSFVKRYRDDTPSADVRIIAAGENDGQAILEEWKSGEATEDSFAELANKYNEGTSFTSEGGLYLGVSVEGTQEDLAAWIFDEARKAGDTGVIQTEDYNYVIYYVNSNKPKWALDIADILLSETMTRYLEEISEPIQVEDVKGNLNYLKLEAAAEAAAEDADAETGDQDAAATETTDAATEE